MTDTERYKLEYGFGRGSGSIEEWMKVTEEQVKVTDTRYDVSITFLTHHFNTHQRIFFGDTRAILQSLDPKKKIIEILRGIGDWINQNCRLLVETRQQATSKSSIPQGYRAVRRNGRLIYLPMDLFKDDDNNDNNSTTNVFYDESYDDDDYEDKGSYQEEEDYEKEEEKYNEPYHHGHMEEVNYDSEEYYEQQDQIYGNEPQDYYNYDHDDLNDYHDDYYEEEEEEEDDDY